MLVLLVGAWVQPAAAQEQTYALVLRGVPLDEAIDQFVRTTGHAVTYDPALVRGEQAFCAMEAGTAEEVLRCILAAGGLDFYRLSSGTYVLTRPAEAAPAYGTVAGVVVDGETGTPLSGAHILLADAGIGTISNPAGQFLLPPLPPGCYALSITHLGYRDWQDSLHVEPDARTTTRVALRAEPVLIAPVVVDGLQRRRPSERLRVGEVRAGDPPAGYAGAPEGTLSGLNAVAGVRTSDVTAEVYVQGGAAGAHEVRLDGVPVYLPLRTLGFIGPFSPFAVERVTVHKAGFGVEAGSRLAGVVDVRQRLEGPPGLAVQVAPIGLNARWQAGGAADGLPAATSVMAAARIGWWELYRPDPLQATLNAWSAPDLFLLQAALKGSSLSEPTLASLFDDGVQALAGRPPPGLHFSDLHLALRHRQSPLRTWYASAYEGRHRLKGSPFAAFEVLRTEMDVDRQPPGTPYRLPVTVEDDQAWQTRAGQLRYDAVVGGRSLLSLQARLSTYDLVHRYELLDSLELLLQPDRLSLSRVATHPVQDTNRMRLYALEGVFDHVQGRHQAQIGVELLLTESRFTLLAVQLPGLEADVEQTTGAEQRSLDAPRQHVRHAAQSWRGALFLRDEVDLGAHTRAEVGVRLTYLPERQTLYAEPRLAVRHDAPWGAARLAAGVYRQFVNQYDVSKLNVGALLPSVRIWLPVDGTVRPPLAVHLGASTLVHLAPAWTLRGEGYWKVQPHQLLMTYRLPGGFAAGDGTAYQGGVLSRQAAFLAPANGRASGASVELAWSAEQVQASMRYEASRATLQRAGWFDGRAVPVPWNEPHRAVVALGWQPVPSLLFSLRGQGSWGRAWGFRQAYYDYLAQDDALRYHPPYDLGRPDDHVLPPYYRLDLGLAYARRIGRLDLQVRLDVLNALDHANVLDWRLVYAEEGALRREARYAYPRLMAWALTLGW